jgi:hypothetical protein
MEKHDLTKVYIRGDDGAYLTGAGTEWEFTTDRRKATVFDYLHDRVGEQLEGLRRNQGILLKVEVIDPREVHESCDQCEQLISPAKAFFDGQKFLCSDCRGSTTAV